MFLLRTAFWLAIIIMILPTDAKNQQYVLTAVKAAYVDFSHFCERNPEVCRESKTAFESFSDKAQFGANLVVDMVNNKPQPTTSTQHRSTTNTLNNSDLRPLWETPSYEFGS